MVEKIFSISKFNPQPSPHPHLHFHPASCRDSFGNVLDLLDDLFERASLADVSAPLATIMLPMDLNINLLFVSALAVYDIVQLRSAACLSISI